MFGIGDSIMTYYQEIPHGDIETADAGLSLCSFTHVSSYDLYHLGLVFDLSHYMRNCVYGWLVNGKFFICLRENRYWLNEITGNDYEILCDGDLEHIIERARHYFFRDFTQSITHYL